MDGGSVPQAAEAAPEKLSELELARLTDALIAQFKTVFDPEIPVDIYELGLIYKVDIDDNRHVDVEMTLTAPGCPVAGEMPTWVEDAAKNVEGVKTVKVNLVFDPPWTAARMSDEAKLELNML
jgi:FeS assembly SUF system protein